jgi:hypothetical protein
MEWTTGSREHGPGLEQERKDKQRQSYVVGHPSHLTHDERGRISDDRFGTLAPTVVEHSLNDRANNFFEPTVQHTVLLVQLQEPEVCRVWLSCSSRQCQTIRMPNRLMSETAVSLGTYLITRSNEQREPQHHEPTATCGDRGRSVGQ